MISKRQRLRDLLRAVQAIEPLEIDCDELLARVAPYLEAVVGGRELRAELRQVGQHLTVCPQCKEEFDALLRAHEIEP